MITVSGWLPSGSSAVNMRDSSDAFTTYADRRRTIYSGFRKIKWWLRFQRQILTVIAAPIRPCTTASPVDCTYRKKYNIQKWVKCQLNVKNLKSFRPLCTDPLYYVTAFCSIFRGTESGDCAVQGEWHVALYLFGSGGHIDYILNAIVKELPRVLEFRRRILNHHQLCGVIDSCQCRPFGIPVHLQKKR